MFIICVLDIGLLVPYLHLKKLVNMAEYKKQKKKKNGLWVGRLKDFLLQFLFCFALFSFCPVLYRTTKLDV